MAGTATAIEPLFRSVHHALAFAYGVSATDIVKMPSLYKMRGEGGTDEYGGPFGRHAQAAQVLSLVRRTLGHKPLMVTYLDVCWGRDYHKAEPHLINYISSCLPTGIYQRRGLQAILLSYCGQPVSAEKLAGLLKKRKETALEWRRMAYDHLDGMHREIFNLLEPAMIEAGLV